MIIGHWSFDARNDIGRDSSGFSHHATPFNITSARAVRSGPGRSAAFDGVDSSMTVSQDLSLNPGLHSASIEFWYEGPVQGTIAGLDGAWEVWFQSGELHAAITDTSGVTASGKITERLRRNKRTHVVVVFDRSIGEVRGLVDGEYSAGFHIPSIGKLISTGPITMGQGEGGALLGQLDEFVYYRGVLEIKDAGKHDNIGRKYRYITEIRQDSLPMLALEFFPDNETPVIDTAMIGYLDELVYDPNSLSRASSLLWSGEGNSAILSSPMSLQSPIIYTCEVIFTSGSATANQLLEISYDNGSTFTVTAEGDTLVAQDTQAGSTPAMELLPLGTQPVPIDYIDGGHPETSDSEYTDPIDGGSPDDSGAEVWDSGVSEDDQVTLFWGHLVVVMVSSAIQVYVNGVRHNLHTVGRHVVDTVALAPNFDAPVQDFTLYDRELDGHTIEFHYQTSSTGRFAMKVSDDTVAPVVNDKGFRVLNYRWSVRNG